MDQQINNSSNNNLVNNTNIPLTKKMLKQQQKKQTKAFNKKVKQTQKLQDLGFNARTEAKKLKKYLWITILEYVLLIWILICIYCYMTPYWKEIMSLKQTKGEWNNQIIQFFDFYALTWHKPILISCNICCLIFPIWTIISLFTWMFLTLKMFHNIFSFKKNRFFWFILGCTALIFNLIVIILALIKIQKYKRLLAINTTNMNNNTTMNMPNNNTVSNNI